MRPNRVLPVLTLGLVLLLAGCDSSDGSSDPGEENPPPEGGHSLTATIDGNAFTGHVIAAEQFEDVVWITATDTVQRQSIKLSLPDDFQGDVSSGEVRASWTRADENGVAQTHEAVSGHLALEQASSGMAEASYSFTLEPADTGGASKTATFEMVGVMRLIMALIVDLVTLDSNGGISCMLWTGASPVPAHWTTLGGGFFLASPQVDEALALRSLTVQGQTFDSWTLPGSDEQIYLGAENEPVDISLSVLLNANPIAADFTYTAGIVEDVSLLNFWLHLESPFGTFDLEADNEFGSGWLRFIHLESVDGYFQGVAEFEARMEDDEGNAALCESGKLAFGLNLTTP